MYHCNRLYMSALNEAIYKRRINDVYPVMTIYILLKKQYTPVE